MSYKVKGGKLQKLPTRKQIRETFRLAASIPPERQAELNAEVEELGPKEFAKLMFRRMLAYEVGEKFKRDTPDGLIPPDAINELVATMGGGMTAADFKGATYHGFYSSIPEWVVIDFLEYVVEGDGIIDDGAAHAWFRRKLDEYREACEKIDADTTTEPFFRVAALYAALDHYDVLIDRADGGVSVREASVIANAKVRELLDSFPFDWEPLPGGADMAKDFRHTYVTFTPKYDDAPPDAIAACLAEPLAECHVRVGMIDKLGGISPFELKEAA